MKKKNISGFQYKPIYKGYVIHITSISMNVSLRN